VFLRSAPQYDKKLEKEKKNDLFSVCGKKFEYERET